MKSGQRLNANKWVCWKFVRWTRNSDIKLLWLKLSHMKWRKCGYATILELPFERFSSTGGNICSLFIFVDVVHMKNVVQVRSFSWQICWGQFKQLCTIHGIEMMNKWTNAKSQKFVSFSVLVLIKKCIRFENSIIIFCHFEVVNLSGIWWYWKAFFNLALPSPFSLSCILSFLFSPFINWHRVCCVTVIWLLHEKFFKNRWVTKRDFVVIFFFGRASFCCIVRSDSVCLASKLYKALNEGISVKQKE